MARRRPVSRGVSLGSSSCLPHAPPPAWLAGPLPTGPGPPLHQAQAPPPPGPGPRFMGCPVARRERQVPQPWPLARLAARRATHMARGPRVGQPLLTAACHRQTVGVSARGVPAVSTWCPSLSTGPAPGSACLCRWCPRRFARGQKRQRGPAPSHRGSPGCSAPRWPHLTPLPVAPCPALHGLAALPHLVASVPVCHRASPESPQPALHAAGVFRLRTAHGRVVSVRGLVQGPWPAWFPERRVSAASPSLRTQGNRHPSPLARSRGLSALGPSWVSSALRVTGVSPSG